MQEIMEIRPAEALMDYAPISAIPADYSGDEHSDGAVIAIEEFPQRLLRALATMAVRSKRRQADLAAALCRGGLESEAAEVGVALQELEAAGFVEQIVSLYDGGVLLAVTSRGIEQLNTMPRWAMLDGAMRLG
jgi:hypothetical protein